jgi:hypothetical protein
MHEPWSRDRAAGHCLYASREASCHGSTRLCPDLFPSAGLAIHSKEGSPVKGGVQLLGAVCEGFVHVGLLSVHMTAGSRTPGLTPWRQAAAEVCAPVVLLLCSFCRQSARLQDGRLQQTGLSM